MPRLINNGEQAQARKVMHVKLYLFGHSILIILFCDIKSLELAQLLKILKHNVGLRICANIYMFAGIHYKLVSLHEQQVSV